MLELNDEQALAASYAGPARNVLVTAGAGCGKTRTIIARAAHLYTAGADPGRILIMTFTNRAARELKTRLRSEIGEAALQMQAGTFHAFCLKVMTKIPRSFSITGLTVLDGDDQNSLMGLLRREFLIERGGLRRSFPKSAQLLRYLSYSRNTCREPGTYLQESTDLDEGTAEACTELYSRYQAAKEQRGYLDYDDLLERFSRTLAEKPPLKQAVCGLYDEVLVDEMQDTNPIQFSVLRHFADEKVRLFCVGDPAQSIYRFRGAEFRHIYEFEERFGSSTTISLSRNYRSFQEILDFANWLLSRSPLDYRNNLRADRGSSGLLPMVEEFEHSSDEAAWTAETILERQEGGLPLSSIMVLFRSSYDAKPLEAELIRRSIPYRFIGGTVLTKSAHVRDVIASLRIVRNAKDDLAWLRFLQLWPRIGEKSASRILSGLSGDKGGMAEQLEGLIGSGHPAVAVFQAALQHFDTPAVCVKQVAGLLRSVLKERYSNWKQRSRDLELLVRAAGNYRDTGEFIDDFTLEPMNDTEIQRPGEDDAVTLITVHSAKGTEAPLCIVAGADQAAYPHVRSLGTIEAEEEERRVLYVALTRAKNELIVTRSSYKRNAFWVSRSPAAGESYFLENLPEAMVRLQLHGWNPQTGSGIGGLKDIY
jgi:DNA helicase II / ATP-dependent DNA helicase PcrA